MPKFVFSLLLLIAGFSLKAQTSADKISDQVVLGDTIQTPLKIKKKYDPKRASTLSAIFPGLGQIYNDSWWKVPILYTGMGVAIYFIDYNNGEFIKARRGVKKLLDSQKRGETINQNELRLYRLAADSFQKDRNLVIITLIGIYGLNIIDAAVDAHLKGFDVSDDLAMNFKPKVGVISNGTPYAGIGITIPIRSK